MIALAHLALVAAVLTGILCALSAVGPSPVHWPYYLNAGVGGLYVAAGVVAWVRRPMNRTGPLLCLCGYTLLVVTVNTPASALSYAGVFLDEAPIGVLLHVLLAYPSGRLPDRLSRLLVIGGYLLTIALHIPRWLFSPQPSPRPPFHVTPNRQLVVVDHRIQIWGAVVIFAITAAVLVVRLRRAAARMRWSLGLVYAYGVFTLLFLVFSANLLAPGLDWDELMLFKVQMTVFAILPVVFLAGVLRGGYARTLDIDALNAWIGDVRPAERDLSSALRTALGDASLTLLFWLPDRGAYVTPEGHPAELPVLDTGRGWVDVHAGREMVGAITYDALMIADPAPVRQAGRVVALAVERERLTAQLRASQAALLDSRARIVESADRERRRIARDLHDGLQGRLVVLGLRAGHLADTLSRENRVPGAAAADQPAAEAHRLRRELDEAITELRDLVHGVMPALLLQRGLPATLEDLLDRSPIRTDLELAIEAEHTPPHVESVAYFVVAEALNNTVKHARATDFRVRLRRTRDTLHLWISDNGVGGASSRRHGSGLAGIRDRVEALGGRLVVRSAADTGTHLEAELPCAS